MMRAGLVWLLLAGSAAAEPLPALFAVTGVASGDVLNVRASPSAEAEIVGTFARDATGVEVVALSGDGKWGQVNFNEGTGHVAMRFLRAEPAPPWYALQLPLSCAGTEPFWSLFVDPDAPVADLWMPEVERSLVVTHRWPGKAHAPMAAVGLEDGQFVVLQPEACSDGMSDRAFGIRADLHLTGPYGATALQGCCNLQP